ncbi:SRPBCC family protein [Arthrobacter mobilis]|uniref:SRPBCC family protein n=1 Tax=Arthrobacter mobilis TaxID=2724944 RepID=A0A7X6HB97_9MICC|nr:SRPBCC family protein [Arthrobacter mobilis]NKX53923.1 SRPBCC family protein [Arthrobacter mobilis]
MATVEESIDVAVPVSTAYNQWTQFESFPEFMGGVESVTQLTDTTNRWKAKVAGVERDFETEIVEQQPDRKVAWRSVDGTTHAGEVTFEPLGDQASRVHVRLQWDTESLTEKVGAALGFDSRQVKADLRRFKEFIEARGAETGAWRGTVEDRPAGDSFEGAEAAARAGAGGGRAAGDEELARTAEAAALGPELPAAYERFLAGLTPEEASTVRPVMKQSASEGLQGIHIRVMPSEIQAMVSNEVPYGEVRIEDNT